MGGCGRKPGGSRGVLAAHLTQLRRSSQTAVHAAMLMQARPAAGAARHARHVLLLRAHERKMPRLLRSAAGTMRHTPPPGALVQQVAEGTADTRMLGRNCCSAAAGACAAARAAQLCVNAQGQHCWVPLPLGWLGDQRMPLPASGASTASMRKPGCAGQPSPLCCASPARTSPSRSPSSSSVSVSVSSSSSRRRLLWQRCRPPAPPTAHEHGH